MFLFPFIIFGVATLLFYLEVWLLIPFLCTTFNIEIIISWFITAGLGIFVPMLVLSVIILKKEGAFEKTNIWRDRLRFKPMSKKDWLWGIGGIIAVGVFSMVVMKLLELAVGKIEHNPPFMAFEPLTKGRYWILALWLPYWVLNIMGEEILWRGVLLPRQELVFKKWTWLIHGICWAVFHIVFGWKLLITLLPLLLIQSFIVQKQKNSWIGVFMHASINGPAFIAISFGLM